MNKSELINIRTRELGFAPIEMAYHLNMPVSDYHEIEKGEYQLSLGEQAIVKTLVTKYSIPNIHDDCILETIKTPDSGLYEKAKSIYNYSYNMLCRSTDGHIDEHSLMQPKEILIHLQNRLEEDID